MRPGYAVNISAAISPDGRYFTFTSEQSLTGYENRNAGRSAQRPRSSSTTPKPTKATGSPASPATPRGRWRWASSCPAKWPSSRPTPAASGRNAGWRRRCRRRPQTDSRAPPSTAPARSLDNGRVFFNSVDPLVAADSNGEWDVYQYQPVGVGSCAATTNTATATRSGAGCVGLLSSGSSEGDAGFLDASESGNDVFFLTQLEALGPRQRRRDGRLRREGERDPGGAPPGLRMRRGSLPAVGGCSQRPDARQANRSRAPRRPGPCREGPEEGPPQRQRRLRRQEEAQETQKAPQAEANPQEREGRPMRMQRRRTALGRPPLGGSPLLPARPAPRRLRGALALVEHRRRLAADEPLGTRGQPPGNPGPGRHLRRQTRRRRRRSSSKAKPSAAWVQKTPKENAKKSAPTTASRSLKPRPSCRRSSNRRLGSEVEVSGGPTTSRTFEVRVPDR